MESNSLEKFQLLLKYVCEGKIVIDECDAEKILKFLYDEQENSTGQLFLNSPDFHDSVFNSLTNINHLKTHMKIFLIRIIKILTSSEDIFTKIKNQVYQNSSLRVCILNNLNNNSPAELHLTCIELFTSQIHHPFGVSSLLEHKVWQHILYADIHRRPKSASEAAYNFIAKLVWKLHEYNLEKDLLEVLDYILEPIVRSEYFDLPVLDTETDQALADKIFAYLSALLAILKEVDNYAPINNVMTLIRDYYILDHKMFDIFESTKNIGLLKLLSPVLFRYSYGMLRHLLYNNEIDDFCKKMTAFHRNYMVFAVQKREAFMIVDYVIQCIVIWSGIEKSNANKFNFPLMFERNGKKIDFSLQIMVHSMIPMIKKYLMKNGYNMDGIEEFTVKMGNSLTEYIYASCYTVADFLEEAGDSLTTKVIIYSLKELLRLKGHLNQSQTGSLFWTLQYSLDMFIDFDDTGELIINENPVDPDDLSILSPLLNVLKMLLKEYHIPWHENLRIVSIQADLLNLLKQQFLTTKHVIQVLDVLEICLQKFISPNMSLLVDINSTPSNTLSEIGKMIMMYTNHDEWEVRESAFNLLRSCTEISFVKYVPLQTVIVENKLMIEAAKAVRTDTDVYSRCTALKCLSAATKINSIWQQVLLADANTLVHLVFILKNNTEGLVRTEAANVLKAVYANQKFDPKFQSDLYEVMMSAAIDDLYWEVQIASLNFWKQAINKHLTDRGMLDGKFPSVTFSKEKRKIIVLNGREIERQLSGVMNDLADIGCLTALIECMDDLNHIAVMEHSYSIVRELMDKLNLYNFDKVDERVGTHSTETPSECTDKVTAMDVAGERNEFDRNEVIEDILKQNQVDLIMHLYDNYDQLNTEEMEIDDSYCPRKKFIQPNKFLESVRSKKHCLTIEYKKQFNQGCVSSLDGLLDEILSIVT